MSETQTIPMTTTVAAAASQFLMPVVLGLQALAVNGKQAHWNVRGENFIAIHELIDAIVGNAQTSADQAAERIVARGLPIDARVGTVAAKTSTRVAAGFTRWDDSVRALIADIDVVIGDASDTLPSWPHKADAWFLDGFSPAKNPDLWEPDLMTEVARHTASQGSFATYTAAGHVRRALAVAGFTVTRAPGHGRKRHMTTGYLT